MDVDVVSRGLRHIHLVRFKPSIFVDQKSDHYLTNQPYRP